jgi:hypothetical protein
VEEQRLSPMTAEHKEHLEQELVAAVSEDEPIGLGSPPSREDLAQLIAATGIAVQQDAVQLVRRDVAARHGRLRPLVRVDAHVGLEHLGAVRLELRKGVAGARQLSIAHSPIA